MALKNLEKACQLLKVKLATILQREINNPFLQNVTITRIKISPDRSVAHVFFSVFPVKNIEKITNELNHAKGRFQQVLAKTSTSRNTPKLNFIFDKGFDHTLEIEQILSKIQ